LSGNRRPAGGAAHDSGTGGTAQRARGNAGAVGAGAALEVDHSVGLVLRARRGAPGAGLPEGGDAAAPAAQGAAPADDVHHARLAVRRTQHGGPRAWPAKHWVLAAALRMVALAVIALALADVGWGSMRRAIERAAL
jgi:hypothetical protein